MITQKTKKTVNGREIEYLDVIHHNSITSFSFYDRIKILFGKKLHVQSQIYTDHEYCKVLGSDSKTFVEPFFTRRKKIALEITGDINKIIE